MSQSAGGLAKDLSKTMTALYKVGGLMLVFVFLAILLTLGGNILGGPHSGALVAVGATLTFSCLILYALPQLQAAGATKKVREFSTQVEGCWWERVRPDGGTALSWVSIRMNQITGALIFNGRAFDDKGSEFANWHSVASCVNAQDGKVFYHWEGYLVADPKKCDDGFGEIEFSVADSSIDTGDGRFSYTRPDVSSWMTKSFSLRRSTAGEKKVMESGDKAARAKVICEKLAEL